MVTEKQKTLSCAYRQEIWRERTGWSTGNRLGAEMEDHSGDKGDVVDDRKVLQLGCRCDSIRAMRGKVLYQRCLKSTGRDNSVSQNNAHYTSFAGTGALFF